MTKDLVCYKFCERNDYTGYPGYVQTNAQPKPAPNQACEYYYQYFDTAHWDRKYELTWGFDGYVLSPCGSTPTITVNDLRECGQGVIQRIISTTGPNNINVTAIQTIWVVDCDPFYIDDVACNDPRYTDLSVIVDEGQPLQEPWRTTVTTPLSYDLNSILPPSPSTAGLTTLTMRSLIF